MNEIEVFNKTDEIVDLKALKELMEYTLKKEQVETVVFNLILIDNKTIHKMITYYKQYGTHIGRKNSGTDRVQR